MRAFEWKHEHDGTIRAVRSKMARIKKDNPGYFTRREWKIIEHELLPTDEGIGYFSLKSRLV